MVNVDSLSFSRLELRGNDLLDLHTYLRNSARGPAGTMLPAGLGVDLRGVDRLKLRGRYLFWSVAMPECRHCE